MKEIWKKLCSTSTFSPYWHLEVFVAIPILILFFIMFFIMAHDIHLIAQHLGALK